MNNLTLTMAYICKHYPYKQEISNARLTKMVYLADFFSVQQNGNQLTNIQWYFDNYGPYVDNIRHEAEYNHLFEAVSSTTIYGTPKLQIKLTQDAELPPLQPEMKKILDRVIDETKHLNWNDFINYVYNTSPVKNGHRYTYLDLSK